MPSVHSKILVIAESSSDDERPSVIGESSAKDVHSDQHDAVWFKHHTCVCKNSFDHHEVLFFHVLCIPF